MSMKTWIRVPSSSRKCLVVLMTIMILTSSLASGSHHYSPRAASPVQRLTGRFPLLDVLMGIGSDSDNKPAATSSLASNSEKQSSSLVDLASSLIGKGDTNTALYLKLFKLLLNLFMDVMMDRMGAERREDIANINPLTPFFLRLKNPVKTPAVNMPYPASQSQSIQTAFKPYFIN